MSDLIDREALLDECLNHYEVGNIEALQAEVERLQAQLPKRGKWIDDEFGAKCSCCGKYAYWSKYEIPWKSPYCPLCGAKMEVQE